MVRIRTTANDFYYLGREVRFKDMQWQSSGIYTGTYVNSYGCESTVDIKVIVDDPAHPYVEPEKPDTGKVALKPQMVAGKVAISKIGGDLLISTNSARAPMMLTIHDLQGELLMRRQIDGFAIVPVAHIAQKPYVVKISSAKKNIYQKIFR